MKHMSSKMDLKEWNKSMFKVEAHTTFHSVEMEKAQVLEINNDQGSLV